MIEIQKSVSEVGPKPNKIEQRNELSVIKKRTIEKKRH